MTCTTFPICLVSIAVAMGYPWRAAAPPTISAISCVFCACLARF
jgi:hypothetical protein